MHPDWRGRGIGTAMLAWSLGRARSVLPRLPHNARLAPRVGSAPSHQPSIQLFEDFGFKPVRYTWTMAVEVVPPMPSPRWPAGIRLRPFQFPDDLEAVYLAMVDAFLDHWGFIEIPLDQGFRQWHHAAVELRPMDPSLRFLAVDGDHIAGIALCRARSDEDPEMGRVNALGVRRPWRQRGLGLTLLQHAFLALEQTGPRRVGLGVDA